MTARILGAGPSLKVAHSDIGFDLDDNTYYGLHIPRDVVADRALVIAMELGRRRPEQST